MLSRRAALLAATAATVEDGLLKVTMFSNSGTERILAFRGPGAIVGKLAIIDGLPRTPSAVAVRDAALRFLSRAALCKKTSSRVLPIAVQASH
jgi:CRP-like cAMP-binding protein